MRENDGVGSKGEVGELEGTRDESSMVTSTRISKGSLFSMVPLKMMG